jgi:hypothetical protein
MKQREVDIQSSILEYLKYRHIFARRNNTGAVYRGGRYMEYGLGRGSSDIIGILPDGRFLAIEVKRKGCKPTPAQDEFAATVERNGGVYILARCVADVDKNLRPYLDKTTRV